MDLKSFKYIKAFLAGRPSHDDDAFSAKHPRMPIDKRAKIFAPFDALDGYGSSIDRKNIQYMERIELEERERHELNRRLQVLHSLTRNSRLARLNRTEVIITYFEPCTDTERFAWQMLGRYETVRGICRRTDLSDLLTITLSDWAYIGSTSMRSTGSTSRVPLVSTGSTVAGASGEGTSVRCTGSTVAGAGGESPSVRCTGSTVSTSKGSSGSTASINGTGSTVSGDLTIPIADIIDLSSPDQEIFADHDQEPC